MNSVRGRNRAPTIMAGMYLAFYFTLEKTGDDRPRLFRFIPSYGTNPIPGFLLLLLLGLVGHQWLQRTLYLTPRQY